MFIILFLYIQLPEHTIATKGLSVKQKKQLLLVFGPIMSKGLVPGITRVAKECGENPELAGAVPEEAHDYLQTKKVEELRHRRKWLPGSIVAAGK